MLGYSKKVYEKLGQDTLRKVEENPYILLDITLGVDFKKIDKMAIDLGVDIENAERISSGIKYSLALASNNGNSCVIYENLVSFTKSLLQISKEPIEEEIINLKAKQEIYIEEIDGNTWVFLADFYLAEKNIAEKLIALDNSRNIKEIKTFKTELKKIEKDEDITLSEEQKEAIKAVNDNNVCIITGGPRNRKNNNNKIHNKNV